MAVRPEIEVAISRPSETFAKMGSCAAEELEFALAAESTGGVQPATPTVDMLKNAAKTVGRVEEGVARGVQEEALVLPATLINEEGVIYKHQLRYHSRIRQRGLQDPKAHNFPRSFDDIILKVKPIDQADGSLLYRVEGTLNEKSGFFEIAVNPETKTIFHRTFVGIKK